MLVASVGHDDVMNAGIGGESAGLKSFHVRAGVVISGGVEE